MLIKRTYKSPQITMLTINLIMVIIFWTHNPPSCKTPLIGIRSGSHTKPHTRSKLRCRNKKKFSFWIRIAYLTDGGGEENIFGVTISLCTKSTPVSIPLCTMGQGDQSSWDIRCRKSHRVECCFTSTKYLAEAIHQLAASRVGEVRGLLKSDLFE